MKRNVVLFLLFWVVISSSFASFDGIHKLSPFVRKAMTGMKSDTKKKAASASKGNICAFVRVCGEAEKLFNANGCRTLAQFGDIYIVDIPIAGLQTLAADDAVQRIEAGERCAVHIDTTALVTGVGKVHKGMSLQQAYTGKGVVMGVQDIGFDLTHPNFYNSSCTEYRIKRFWDQLSTDVSDAGLYVGADYRNGADILKYARSRDGLVQTHGTHTLGIAAGSGYDTVFRGVAYESDICIVSNAVTDDIEFIDDEDLYKYTSATDALGFKYIFDYATEVGKPCVISFSEGSHQGFSDEDVLFYEVLGQMVGPGRILVASAGNEGDMKTYLRKPAGKESSGTFFGYSDSSVYFKLRSADVFYLCLTVYGEGGHTCPVKIKSSDVVAAENGEMELSLNFNGADIKLTISGYPSCYDNSVMAYEVLAESSIPFGSSLPLSAEITGSDADVELFYGSGALTTNELRPDLCGGEKSHSIYSPGSAPAVICVGATSYRPGMVNTNGVWVGAGIGRDGVRGYYSSAGPTMDGRIKPEVMAPGTNVASSFSHFFMENGAADYHRDRQVATSLYNGTTYPWNMDSGTSMSTPVVGGIIALWLEANPTLSPEDIRGILARTCNTQNCTDVRPDNYNGYGEIDAYKGLLDVLGLSGIDEISTFVPKDVEIVPRNDGSLCFSFASAPANPVHVKIFSTAGQLCASHTLPAGMQEVTLKDTKLKSGVYVVQVCATEPENVGSMLIRIR